MFTVNKFSNDLCPILKFVKSFNKWALVQNYDLNLRDIFLCYVKL